MAHYVKEVDGDLMLGVGFDTIVELKEYLRELRERLRPPVDAPTAYCATCGHDSPADECDYPGEPERGRPGMSADGLAGWVPKRDEPVSGLTGAGVMQFVKEWRQRADELDKTGNSWASSAAGVYRYCANAIDPTHCNNPTDAPTLPDDEPSYTVNEVVELVKKLPLHSSEVELKTIIRNFKGK